MAFLTGLKDIASKRWGRTYLWDVRFQNNAPDDFRDWFPAIEIDENLYDSVSFDFEAGLSTYKIPKSTSLQELKMTFYDTIDGSLRTWLTEWVNETILGGGKFVRTIEEVSRLVQIVKLDYDRKTQIEATSYLVYPEGPLNFVGNSDSEVPTYSVNFIIVGK